MRVYLPLCPYPSLSGPLEDETTIDLDHGGRDGEPGF
jgi:hypothetical protein